MPEKGKHGDMFANLDEATKEKAKSILEQEKSGKLTREQAREELTKLGVKLPEKGKHKEMFASGILKLPPTGLRDITESHNAFITFYVIRGIVEVTVGTNKFITPAGCSFQVPSFNSYSFKNKGKEEVQLFFVQVIVPETFNSQQDPANHSNKGDVSDKDGFSMSDDESSKMVNLKDRHISDSQTKIRPSAIQQKLFISSSSSNL